VMGWGHDQAVVVKPTPDDRTTVAIYGQQSGSPDIVCLGLHQCDPTVSSELVDPLLTALVPSLSSSPKPAGQDLLQISRRKNGKQQFIAFHTHVASGDQSDPLQMDASTSARTSPCGSRGLQLVGRAGSACLRLLPHRRRKHRRVDIARPVSASRPDIHRRWAGVLW
jgi:hypothetical protein